MWPWEHAALGYLLFSLGLRTLGRSPPSDAAAFVLLFATQLPDLIDKPLSWGFGVFPSGYALGHSVFVALPVGLLALAWGLRGDRPRLGVAFAVGYWSHLASDVLDPLRYGLPPNPGRVLWPVVTGGPYEEDLGIGRGFVYIENFLASLWALDPVTLIVAYLLLPVGTIVLWVIDGTPGLAPFFRLASTIRRQISESQQ